MHANAQLVISIHAPHEGERRRRNRTMCGSARFQSTLPTRGSDASIYRSLPHRKISIHAPHEGERQLITHPYTPTQTISIHAPHEGERLDSGERCDCEMEDFNPRSPRGGATLRRELRASREIHFNPRSPRGGATFSGAGIAQHSRISIHAPHEGERPTAAIKKCLIC